MPRRTSWGDSRMLQRRACARKADIPQDLDFTSTTPAPRGDRSTHHDSAKFRSRCVERQILAAGSASRFPARHQRAKAPDIPSTPDS